MGDSVVEKQVIVDVKTLKEMDEKLERALDNNNDPTSVNLIYEVQYKLVELMNRGF